MVLATRRAEVTEVTGVTLMSEQYHGDVVILIDSSVARGAKPGEHAPMILMRFTSRKARLKL